MHAPTALHESDRYDLPMCGLVANVVAFDGQPELLVGTYGGQVLAYRAVETSPSTAPLYALAWRHELAHPVCGVHAIDVTRDGVRELVVQTLLGVHVLQASPGPRRHWRMRSMRGAEH